MLTLRYSCWILAVGLLAGCDAQSDTGFVGNGGVAGGASGGNAQGAGEPGAGAAGTMMGSVAGTSSTQGSEGNDGSGADGAGAGGGGVNSNGAEPDAGTSGAGSGSMPCVNTMNDANHCGACDSPCEAMQACSGGECLAAPAVLTTIPDCGALWLARNGNWLHVLTRTGALSTIDLTTHGAPISVAAGLGTTNAFTVDGAYAYVATTANIRRVMLDPGLSTDIVVTSEASPIHDVAFASGQLYYAAGRRILEVSEEGIDANGVLTAEALNGGDPRGVATAGLHVAYANSNTSSVEAVLPYSDEPIITLAAARTGLRFGHRSVQAYYTEVYWLDDGGVHTTSLSDPQHVHVSAALSRGGTPVAYSIALPKAFAEAPRDVYVASLEGDLEKVTLGESTATWLARGLPDVSSVVVNTANVYVASGCTILYTPL